MDNPRTVLNQLKTTLNISVFAGLERKVTHPSKYIKCLLRLHIQAHVLNKYCPS